MKKGLALILIFAHMVAVFHFTVPYLSYFANFSYFATELCINQNNSELDCNGACQLDKMLHHQHQQKKDAASHHVDRAPKVDFFFQKTTVSNRPSVTGSQFYRAKEDKMVSLWQAEPSSPPPQLA